MIRILFIFFLLVSPCFAFTWDVMTDCDVDPEDDTPAWDQGGTASYSSSDGNILTIDCITPGGAATNYYSHQTAGYYWPDNVSNATGWTVEVKMLVLNSAATDLRLSIWFRDGTYSGYLKISEGSITLSGDTDQSYDHTNTVDYVTYRITGVGNNYKVYVDGTLRITNTDMGTETPNLLYWGDINGTVGENSKSKWDYFYYYCGGAEAPEAPPTVVAAAAIVNWPLIKSGDCVGHQMINQGMVN